MSSESPVHPGLDGVDVEIVEFASAGNDSLAHGSTPDAIVAKAGPPHSAKYVTVVVVPLPVLIDADTGKSARVENRLPIGRIEAGAIIQFQIVHPLTLTRTTVAVMRSEWRKIVTPSPGSQFMGSVFIGQIDCG